MVPGMLRLYSCFSTVLSSSDRCSHTTLCWAAEMCCARNADHLHLLSCSRGALGGRLFQEFFNQHLCIISAASATQKPLRIISFSAISPTMQTSDSLKPHPLSLEVRRQVMSVRDSCSQDEHEIQENALKLVVTQNPLSNFIP